jgi:hypothetical protein
MTSHSLPSPFQKFIVFRSQAHHGHQSMLLTNTFKPMAVESVSNPSNTLQPPETLTMEYPTVLVGGLYYLIGENKLDGSAFQSINCYSSPDLVNWGFVRKLLTVGQGPSDLATGRVVERPHVIYNTQTKKYVMVS